jgi:hypothetical protein
MSEILSIIGKDTGDYFQILCADCGSPTKNVYEGRDPAGPSQSGRRALRQFKEVVLCQSA